MSSLGHLIICDQDAKDYIIKTDAFQKLNRFAVVEFVIIPSAVKRELSAKEFSDIFYLLYGLLDHIGVELAIRQQANLFLLPIDSVLSKNSLGPFINLSLMALKCVEVEILWHVNRSSPNM